MSLFDKAIDPSIVAPVAAAPIAPQFEEATKKKREAPEAWGNNGVTVAGKDHYFQRKFFRIEKEQKLDKWVLDRYEEAYNLHMEGKDKDGQPNTADNFPIFRMVSWIEVVPANGATSQEITGEIELVPVTR